jgi:hypothetical protein
MYWGYKNGIILIPIKSFLKINIEFHTSVGITFAKPQRNENVIEGRE